MKILPFLACSLFATTVFAEPPPAPNSFAYILQADSFAKAKPQAVRRLAATNRDWLVLDAVFESETPWTREDLDAIRAGKPGRKIISYLSIGEAEDYRPYWHDDWVHRGKLTATAPGFLVALNPEWKGNYKVKYWDAAWQQIILATIDDIMDRGFDGLYLDIIDGFEFFEQDGRNFIDDRVNPETSQSYRRDMVDWVKAIGARAHAKNPAALIIPQNGSQLAAQPEYVANVDGIGIEDLFTNGNKLQPKPDFEAILGYLRPIQEAGKPVLLIEYPKSPQLREHAQKKAAQNGFVWLVTDRQLKTLGISGR